MSTPSTLPPHHPNYGYPHHQNYQSTSGYRAANSLLNGASRLGAYNLPTPPSIAPSSNSHHAANPSRAAQSSTHSSRSESDSAAMPISSASSKPPAKKRQRLKEPREPDWHKFYQNGLPKEVIVIDDSPPPEASASAASNGHAVGGSSRHTAKKRKREDAESAYDPVYQYGRDLNGQTPLYEDSASGSTISTDRTTSAIHTTAATSLGSHSSNGQNGYDVADIQPGQKRKRTATRLQLANEAKKKELEVNGDAFSNYRPPPRPPIKAPDVQVKQIVDVSTGEHIVAGSADRTRSIYTIRTARSTMRMATI
jgi:dual-specificity kinase